MRETPRHGLSERPHRRGWALIEPHFQPKDRRGNASKHPRKRIVDAIMYVTEGGIKWRMLPKDFPPWQTVYEHFNRWCKTGVWEAALDPSFRTSLDYNCAFSPQA